MKLAPFLSAVATLQDDSIRPWGDLILTLGVHETTTETQEGTPAPTSHFNYFWGFVLRSRRKVVLMRGKFKGVSHMDDKMNY